jgi:hypothetical protein
MISVRIFLCAFLVLMVGCGSVVRYSEIWSTPKFLRIAGDRHEQSHERDKKEWSLYESRRGVNFRIDSSDYVRVSTTTWVFGAVPIPEEKGPLASNLKLLLG